MIKPIFLGFAMLELLSLLMYETYFDMLQPYSGEEKLQSQFIDADALI